MDRNRTEETVVLRPARAGDERAVRRLAALDSSAAPSGTVLLAEVDGELVAALGTEDGRGVADPFRFTSALLDLLRVHAMRLA